MLYLHFCIYFDCKDTNKIGNKEVLCKKNRIATKKSQNIWNFQLYVVSLHRQNVSFGYPGKFPERASRIRHYPFKSHLRVVFYFLKLFIIIRRKPLLVARLRFTDIVFLPVNIKTSDASDDISKYLFISVVRLRTL